MASDDRLPDALEAQAWRIEHGHQLRRRLDPDRLLVFGSLARGAGAAARDIDLLLPEFADDRMFADTVTLAVYERLSIATGKPVDLLFTGIVGEMNVSGTYSVAEGWRFCMLFVAANHLADLREMTFADVVRAAARPGF